MIRSLLACVTSLVVLSSSYAQQQGGSVNFTWATSPGPNNSTITSPTFTAGMPANTNSSTRLKAPSPLGNLNEKVYLRRVQSLRVAGQNAWNASASIKRDTTMQNCTITNQANNSYILTFTSDSPPSVIGANQQIKVEIEVTLKVYMMGVEQSSRKVVVGTKTMNAVTCLPAPTTHKEWSLP